MKFLTGAQKPKEIPSYVISIGVKAATLMLLLDLMLNLPPIPY